MNGSARRRINALFIQQLQARYFPVTLIGFHGDNRIILVPARMHMPPVAHRTGGYPLTANRIGRRIARLPLGLRPGLPYLAAHHDLRPGDRLLFTTDGIPEARGADGEPMGYEGLTRLIRECSTCATARHSLSGRARPKPTARGSTVSSGT